MQDIWVNAFSNAYAGFSFMLLLYALLAAVALLVIMRVTGLLRRETRWRRLFVCLYYLYIPVVFIMCGAAWSSVGSVERSVLGAIQDAKPAISSTAAEYASSAWKSVTATFKQDKPMSIREMCLAIADDYVNKLMAGFIPERANMVVQSVMQPVVNSMKDGVVHSVALAVEEMVLKKVADVTSVDQSWLRSFWAVDFTAALEGGLVSAIITHHAQQAMSLLYTKVRLMFVLLMLPVILETAFALYRRRKQPSEVQLSATDLNGSVSL